MSIEKNKPVPRVVLDTNVYISALHFGGKAAQMILYAQRGIIDIYLSRFILEEIQGVLMRKFYWQLIRTKEAIKLLEQLGRVIVPLERLTVIEDEPDNRILECAVSARVDYLVSGDKHLLKFKEFQGIRIITVNEFLEILNLG
jgi:uncharacterized protein